MISSQNTELATNPLNPENNTDCTKQLIYPLQILRQAQDERGCISVRGEFYFPVRGDFIPPFVVSLSNHDSATILRQAQDERF
jgi:hypothetical protein